jgi:hypothetical protein
MSEIYAESKHVGGQWRVGKISEKVDIEHTQTFQTAKEFNKSVSIDYSIIYRVFQSPLPSSTVHLNEVLFNTIAY